MKAAAFALLLTACAGHAVSPAPARPVVKDDPAAFERGEDEVLRDLSAIDERFALRAHIEPSEEDLHRVAMTALLHEDPTLAVNDGAIDPFSFDARARGLDAVKQKLAALPASAGERDLLARVVDGEVARLEEERLLPRSAAALVRALVTTWSVPKDEKEMADDDRWLARRIRELRESMDTTDPSAALDVIRARDLDDSLDSLEALARGMVKATQELVKLREALEAAGSRPAMKAHSEWNLVSRRLVAEVGVSTFDFDPIEKELRKLAETALDEQKIDLRGGGLEARIGKQLFVSGACITAVNGSRVRSLTAPHEREASCQLVKNVAKAEDPRAKALALAAMHAHLVVAQWALVVAKGEGSIRDAEDRHHMLVPLVQPDLIAHLERIALARPVGAIAAGETARLLTKGDPFARANAWAAIGDVPLDVAARELP